ncbi:Y-family DNA polymerase [Sphingobacterium sp. LRF_L2]|uniref:Y-family DNA polymerase n=1 Tax=Sphingobacterium sp. LRF_L2 TaxID=3369421 RepID=UPI003F5F3F0B
MKRFAVLYFPFLLTDRFVCHNPIFQDKPLAFTLPLNGRVCITATNELAQLHGIFPPMVLADAKAALPALDVFPDHPLRPKQLLKKIGLWLVKFTPAVAVDDVDGLILDITGCSHLWGGEENYVHSIKEQLQHKGYNVRIGTGNTVGIAWAASRYTKSYTIVDQNEKTELYALPPQALRLDAVTTERLIKLGLRSIGSFIDMPIFVLRRRFGESLIIRINQFLGKTQEMLTFLRPVLPYSERLPCLEPISTVQGIEIALQKLLDKLCFRLVKEGKGLRKGRLTCYRLDGKTQSVEIGTTMASASSKHLFRLLQLKISQIEPGLGIEVFLLEALFVEDNPAVQELLWNPQNSLESTELGELLDRIKGRIPDCHINRYLPAEHHWPERAIRPADALNEKATIAWPQNRPRPIRLLHQPCLIEVTAPIPDYPPMLFRYQGKVHTVHRADGPERIEREWWLEKGEHRDYYYVEDNDGKRYWIFRLGHYGQNPSPRWFLHGFFA